MSDKPIENLAVGWLPGVNVPCNDCAKAARRAYSDGTTPGFHSPFCDRHRPDNPAKAPERVIEVAPGEFERCGPTWASGQGHYESIQDATFGHIPAVPAQVAPDWPTYCTHGKSIEDDACEECQKADLNCRPAEPQVVAQSCNFQTYAGEGNIDFCPLPFGHDSGIHEAGAQVPHFCSHCERPIELVDGIWTNTYTLPWDARCKENPMGHEPEPQAGAQPAAQPVSAPSPEIPDDLRRSYNAAKFELEDDDAEGWSAEVVMDFIERIGRAESALRVAREDLARGLNVEFQRTRCAVCHVYKHTPVRNDDLGGYVCGGCLEKAYSAEREARKQAEDALRKIADWELPSTGETWPSGGPVSYEANVGSNGVRDYIRSVARTALESVSGSPERLEEREK